MSLLEKYNQVFMNKDEAGMNEVLHDDYTFTMHASGNVLTKQDVIKWAMSDDINREKVRILYENDEIGVEHSFVTFSDAINKSPSFSRFSSSIRIIILPCL